MRKCCKSLPKHVRQVKALLESMGAAAVEIVRQGRYVVSWLLGRERVHVDMSLSPGGNAYAAARTSVRRIFRQHGFAVPA